MLTIKETFDKVKTHLLKQNKRSMLDSNGDKVCAYRGDGGLRCAVGCLISDKEYSGRLEGLGVSSEVVASALMDSGIDTSNHLIREMLAELQSLHDCVSPNKWPETLNEVEEKYGLV